MRWRDEEFKLRNNMDVRFRKEAGVWPRVGTKTDNNIYIAMMDAQQNLGA